MRSRAPEVPSPGSLLIPGRVRGLYFPKGYATLGLGSVVEISTSSSRSEALF
jgi:hypothetical protein